MASWMLPFFFVDNKEKWAPCALPVSHHDGGETLLSNPQLSLSTSFPACTHPLITEFDDLN